MNPSENGLYNDWEPSADDYPVIRQRIKEGKIKTTSTRTPYISRLVISSVTLKSYSGYSYIGMRGSVSPRE